MVTDPIADLLTRIRNVVERGGSTVLVPQTTMVEETVKLLAEKTIIDGYTVIDPTEEQMKKTGPIKYLKLSLAFDKENGKSVPRITGLKRISRPGVRQYSKAKDLKKVRSGFGVAIISTSKGLMTDVDARKKGLGGEILFEIW